MKKILCILLVPIIFFTSYSDDDSTQPQETAPTVLPQSSMVMDFSEFPDTSTSALTKGESTYQNWGWAALSLISI